MTEIETDYLIVGAGAAGMAFADELTAHGDFDVVMVDRRHHPGGHWNDGYPFLRLHQPSAIYGVNSQTLGTDSIDATGPNAGFYERATAVEICDYYRKVLERLVASGAVRFFGGCDYVGNWSSEHSFASRLHGRTTTVRVRKRVVDATYLQSAVPATHAPTFEAADQARVVPVGRLVDVADNPAGYTVLGAGKTAMDACGWLLDNGVDADRIRWIKPREAWVLDRRAFQPLDLLGQTMDLFSRGVEAVAEGDSVHDVLRRAEASGLLARLDQSVEPTMFKGAILSAPERDALRRISRIVRLGRVLRIGADRVKLEYGEIPTSRDEVHVDCTAEGLPVAPVRTIFEPARITLQSLIGGQTCPAAALVAFVETARDDDVEKNRLCPPVPNPSTELDFIRCTSAVVHGFTRQMENEDLMAWSQRSRLSLTRAMDQYMIDERMQSALARWAANAQPAAQNAEQLLLGVGSGSTPTSPFVARPAAPLGTGRVS